jgi:hypothetical protein
MCPQKIQRAHAPIVQERSGSYRPGHSDVADFTLRLRDAVTPA